MRTFVAIEIPDHIRARIAELLEALRKTSGSVRWSRPEALHITLKFLGEVPVPKVPDIEARLRSIRLEDGALPLEISIRDSGYFPSDRSPRVIWLGIQAAPALAQFAAQMDAALLPLGIAKEDRPFSPHLTLGRIRESGPLTALRDALRQRQPLELGSFAAEEFILYESQLAPGGSNYRKVARFSLAGGGAGALIAFCV